MNWISVTVAVVLMSAAVMFAFYNGTEVQLKFASLETVLIPLYIPIFFSFVSGILGGMLILSFSRRKHKGTIKKLTAANQNLQDEVDNLRNLPLHDES